jgi:succinate-acetate transporter protein
MVTGLAPPHTVTDIRRRPPPEDSDAAGYSSRCAGGRRVIAQHLTDDEETAMTAPDATAADSVQPTSHPEEAAPAEAARAGPLAGDPSVIGLPSFIVGSVALGLVLAGMVPATAVGASLPIILAATAIGQYVTAFWAASIGQNAVASVFAIFGGFWLSYPILVLGLEHNWFGITATAATHTQELFLISWLMTIVMLTLATLRLPLAFTAVFAFIDLALLLVLLGTINANTNLVKAGGYVVFVFAAIGAYLYFGVLSVATGGKPLPLGKPVLH